MSINCSTTRSPLKFQNMISNIFFRCSALMIVLFALTFTSCKKNQDDDLTFTFSEAELAEMRANTCLTIDADEPTPCPTARKVACRTGPPAPKTNFGRPAKPCMCVFSTAVPHFRNSVFAYAKEWENYANIKFVRVSSGNADLRIAFDKDGHWSYLWNGEQENPGQPENHESGIQQQHEEY